MTRGGPVLTAHTAQTGDTPIACATLRELFAGLAMAGLLAVDQFRASPNAAAEAVEYADALLAALAEREDA